MQFLIVTNIWPITHQNETSFYFCSIDKELRRGSRGMQYIEEINNSL